MPPNVVLVTGTGPQAELWGLVLELCPELINLSLPVPM